MLPFHGAKRGRYVSEMGIPAEDAKTLTDDKMVATFFEGTVAEGADPLEACKWIVGDLAGYLNRSVERTQQVVQ
ncbi:unnamed protein product, partial [Discosporangium mesarthrocarpum]